MTFTRRQWLSIAGATGLCAAGSQVLALDQNQKPLRVIAYNVFACTGWPKNRKLSKAAVADGQMAKRLAMELSLHNPDIINFSESPSEQLVKQIATLLGMNYVRFPSGGRWPGTLLSRYEIIDSKNVPMGVSRPKELFTRHWGRATIKLPTGQPLIVHSAHLFPTADVSVRLREIAEMLKAMKPDLSSGRSMLLMGDLNHGPNSREYKLWMKAGWVDTFAKVGNGRGFTIKSDIPRARIDYVMAVGPISKRIIESRPLFEGAFRLHIADKRSFALSDHLPQLAVFK